MYEYSPLTHEYSPLIHEYSPLIHDYPLDTIERDIHDIRDTFEMMSEIVRNTQPSLDTLETSVVDTSVRTAHAVEELDSAEKSGRKRRNALLTLGFVSAVVISLPVVAVAGVPAAIATTTLLGGGVLYKTLSRRKVSMNAI